MPRSTPPRRATALITILAILACTQVALAPALASASVIDNTPSEHQHLNLGSSKTGAVAGSGGASLVRTIVGLAIVIAVIWGLTWLLRRVKAGRDAKSAGEGLASMATLPLGSGRSLQLVRAGTEYVLLGVAEHGVVPVHRYSEQEAQAAGLLELASADPLLDGPPARTSLAVRAQGDPRTPLDRLRRWTVLR